MRKIRKLVTKILASRRAFVEVRKLLAQQAPLTDGRYRVGVYFADSSVNGYQLRQWYAPLRQLSLTHPVLVIARHPLGAKLCLQESGLAVAFAPKVTDLEQLVDVQPLDLVFYVNQNTRNFQMMRYGSRWHVFINHGESDKMYMTSNQYKAYDYAFIAGAAARARLGRALWNYNLDSRTFAIGRPQNDHLSGTPPFTPDDRIVVCYCPTWEGDRPAARYGSVASHGERLVARLLDTGKHRVVYRPHPRSGVVDPDFGAANQRIIAALAAANRRDPAAQHIYDTQAALDWQLHTPELMICDISAMVYDRLATGKPLLVTRPEAATAHIDTSGYLGACEWLDTHQLDAVDTVIDQVLHDRAAKEKLAAWALHYFGDHTPGAPTRRFHAAVDTLLDRAQQLRAENSPSTPA